MSLAQKREMAQFLSMSVSSAQEEETQRKNRELEEEKLMEQTLNTSINVVSNSTICYKLRVMICLGSIN